MTLGRREFFTLAGTAAAAGARGRARAARRSRPNILMLMTDQHRADCVGAYGNHAIRTPNLDRIAREVARFDCAYSSTPTCTPARSALLTGLSPWRHGMLGMTAMAERYPLEKPQALRDAGYYTTAIGKQHFHPMRNGHGYHRMILDEHCACGLVHEPQAIAKRAAEDRCDYEAWFWSQAPTLDPHATKLGWNDYPARAFALPEDLHPTHWTAQTAVNFLKAYNRQEPFFLKVSFIRPHSPYDPPERFMRMYQDAELPKARVGAWAARYAERSGTHDQIWHGKLSGEEIRRSRQGYYGSVTHVDEAVGRILETLEKRGWLDETLIVFLSDHGDMLGDHNLWRKSYAYEQSARIPMLMRWPAGLCGAPRGTVSREPVELRDIFPTFLHAAGVTPPRKLDGESLLALLDTGGRGWRPFIDLEHDICYSPSNHWSALSDGKWKYIFHARDGEEQLFHLAQDPGETNDLAADPRHQAELKNWREKLVAHLSERGEAFVRGGKLALRPDRMMTSPHFPGARQPGAARR